MNNHIKNLEFLLKLEKSSAWPPEKKKEYIDALNAGIQSIKQLRRIKEEWLFGDKTTLTQAIEEAGEK